MPKILVVDDHCDVVSGLSKLLQTHGYSVRCCFDGHRALELAVDWGPDVILLDYMMPGLDGLEVLRRLREGTLTSGIKVIMVSAVDDEGFRDYTMSRGAHDFWAKPIDWTKMHARLAAALDSY